MAKKEKAVKSQMSYGIGEWYGELYKSLSPAERMELVGEVGRNRRRPCPFMANALELAPKGEAVCNKQGGVCSLRAFIPDRDGVSFGPLTATCPNRFLDDKTVFAEIGRLLLGTDNALTAKEIPFLIRPDAQNRLQGAADNAEPDGNEDVGRIDMVMAHPNLDRMQWCAVELQAVYFSGGAMSKDFEVIKRHAGAGVPPTGGKRRPDYRSCGPKRLMPQLQIKVPTLRRWGKKMAVVIDRGFFDSLGAMDDVRDVSNADIAWFVVRFDEDEAAGAAKLTMDQVRYTTLERAVEGLTAGVPATLADFEQKIRGKILR